MPAASTPRRVITINLSNIITKKSLTLLAAAIVVVAVPAFFWWYHDYTSPQNVFNGMLETSLSTRSVTREVNSGQDGETVAQYTQLSFAGEPRARSLVVLKQKIADNVQSEVKTETIGTPQDDFSKYLSINTGQKNASGMPLDFSKVEGVWSKAAAEQRTQNLQNAIVGFVLFANFNSEQRTKFIGRLHTERIYDIDYSKVKSEKVANRSVWTYPVKLNIASYAAVLKDFVKELGLGELADFNPADYASYPPVELSFSIDKGSQQLVQLNHSDGNQKELYSSYGLSQSIELPASTISLSDLQGRVQAVH